MATSKLSISTKRVPARTDIDHAQGTEIFNYKKATVAISKHDSDNLRRKQTDAVFIFDVDPDNDQITNEMINWHKTDKINKYFGAKNKVLIFTSNSRFEVLHKYIVETGKIKTGFLVCNGGAVVYDIETKKFLVNSELGEQEKAMLSHTVQMQTLFALASSSKNDLIISSNYLETKKFAEHCYVPRQSTDDYLKFNSFIHLNKILSMICYESNKDQLSFKHDLLKKLSEDFKISVSNINNNWFIVTPKGYTKVNAVYQVLNYLNHTNINIVYYFALNTFNTDLWWLAKNNHYISRDCLIANKKFLSRHIKYDGYVFSTEKFKQLLISILPMFKEKIPRKKKRRAKKQNG